MYYCLTNTNLNHTGAYIYAKGKIMIHLTLDYIDDKGLPPGEYLRYHRTFQGLSTKELAERSGIFSNTLTLYEKGKHPVKRSNAIALARELNIDYEKLLDEYASFVDYPCNVLLQKIRSDLGLTQEQIASEIGIAQNSYSGWERGARTRRRQEYNKIVAAFKRRKIDICRLVNPAALLAMHA